MKNADMPAMPTHDVFEHCGFDGNSGPHMTQTTNYGLTKREMMAMHMLSGLLSDPNWTGVPADAIRITDELLSELDRTSK
jgi:hypothetical protein